MSDLKAPKNLLKKLREATDALSQYLHEQLSEATRKTLTAYDGAKPPSQALQIAVIDDLNRLLYSRSLYDPQRFKTLTAETNELLAQKPEGKDLRRLNRWLLEEAYPEEISWNPRRWLYFYTAHNELHFYTWGEKECCLPKGATTATLSLQPGSELRLNVGDVLIFEEVKGAKTGNLSDADPKHRHPVRLSRVERFTDPLNEQPVAEIEWAEEDALPFALCLSAIGPAPECELIENISVARGNVVLADHGRSLEENLARVQMQSEIIHCAREGRPEEAAIKAAPIRLRLQNGPLTFRQLLPKNAPAAGRLQQDPKQAEPQIELPCSCVTPGEIKETTWLPQRDLLRSNPEDPHFVVEMDNEGLAHLRFGDGQSGRKPSVGEQFTAKYRVGNGAAGKVGAESVAHVVTRQITLSGVSLAPRNPFPAAGGVEPESLDEVKLFAPTAFRKRLERAIAPNDYAELVKQRHPRVQKAAATLRWKGSWYEVLVAIDPLAEAEAKDDLLETIRTDLQSFRRMGHDLVVTRAEFVPLDVRMEVRVLPNYLRGHVKAELLKIFSNQVLPDGALGFFHPDNWTFGQAVRLSNLYAEAQKVPGVESVNITRFERLFEGPNEELKNAILPISSLEIARLDNDPNFPENGRLELIVSSGR